MTNLAVSLSLYSSTSINDALRLPVSMANDFFEAKAFSDWRKAKESEMKIQSAVVERLNTVVRAIGVVVKAIGGIR